MTTIEGTLVILTPGFADSEEDSTCLPMQQSFVRTLSGLYPQVKVVILSFQYPYRQSKYAWHAATIYSFNGKNKGGIPRLLLRRKILQTLKEIHNSEDIIGILSFWYGECAAIGNIFGRKFGILHRCWILGQDARKGNKYPGRCSIPPNELVALSDFIQAEFEKNYGIKPAHVVPPGINPLHMPMPSGIKDIDILAAGSLIPLKQYSLFIELVATLKKERSTLKTMLVGDGPEKEKLEATIGKHSLEDILQSTGELPHDVLVTKMQRSKVFLHPSSYEGFVVVALEALYAGAQVISFVQPMNYEIQGWHIVKTLEEMTLKTRQLLQSDANFKSSIPFHMNDTVEKMLASFEKG